MISKNSQLLRTPSLIAAIIIVIWLSGCTTVMKGGPASAPKYAEGIRYYLPAVHIVLTPMANGTIEVKQEYWPDPNNAYTLDVDTYLASATFNVEVVNGLLKSVELNTDTGELAASALEAASAIEKARFDASQAEKKEKADEEKVAADKKKSELDAVRVKEQEIALLKVQMDFYEERKQVAENAGDSDGKKAADTQILALELQIRKAKAELGFLRSAAGIATEENGESFNDPSNLARTPSKAYGPIIFRVFPDGEGVRLVAVEKQKMLDTTSSAVPVKPPSPIQDLTFHPTAGKIRKQDNKFDVQFTFSRKVTLDRNKSVLSRVDSNGIPVDKISEGNEITHRMVDENSKILEITIPSDLPPGTYELEVQVKPEKEDAQVKQLPINVIE